MNRSRTFALDLLCLALIALITIGTGHLVLKAALKVTDTLAQEAALRGM